MSDLFERILLLKKSPIFEQVDIDDLRHVALATEDEPYFAGDRVFDVNEQGDRMYIVQSGRIGISLHTDPQVREFIALLGPGECFGEMNLLDEQPRSATAHVVEDCTLLSLEKSRLRGLIINYPELSLGIMRGLSLKVREANQRQLARARDASAQGATKRGGK